MYMCDRASKTLERCEQFRVLKQELSSVDVVLINHHSEIPSHCIIHQNSSVR